MLEVEATYWLCSYESDCVVMILVRSECEAGLCGLRGDGGAADVILETPDFHLNISAHLIRHVNMCDHVMRHM